MHSPSKSGWYHLKFLAETLGLDLLYVIMARFGFLFAIPPGNVTLVWLPSGLAADGPGDAGDRERCLAAGANGYMTKPISLKGLAEMIECLLRPEA